MIVVVAPTPPNDAGDDQTSANSAGNEKIMANEGSRRLLWWGSLGGVEPIIHASRKIEKGSSLPTGRLLLHHPKT